jgi:hypothetical protein
MTRLPTRQTFKLAPAAVQQVLGLRLLIARAANVDSLSWWEDDALTGPARYVLQRLFPTAPPLAARSLALRAALSRHEAVVPSTGLHLYRLHPDNLDRLALRFEPRLPIPVPEDPIETLDALREQLRALTGKDAMPYEIVGERLSGAVQIDVPPTPEGREAMVHRAQTLAWAYLEGQPEQPIFPFCMPDKT